VISANDALGPRAARATPPGIRRVSTNVNTVTPNTTATDCTSLRTRKPATVQKLKRL
jgi:hypothetical protein